MIYKLKVSFSAALDCCEYAIIRGMPIFMYSWIVTNHQIKNSMTICHCILCTDYSRAPTNLRIHGNTIFLQTMKIGIHEFKLIDSVIEQHINKMSLVTIQ